MRDHARLGKEAANDAAVMGQRGVDDLDRDPAVEGAVGGLEDDAHAAAPQLALELILRPQGTLEAFAQVGPDGITHPRLHSSLGNGEKAPHGTGPVGDSILLGRLNPAGGCAGIVARGSPYRLTPG